MLRRISSGDGNARAKRRISLTAPDFPLDADEIHATYEPEPVGRFFRVLGHADRILKTFASRFQGKQSPVHFFWGGFDLASTRFSGRRAPPRPDADKITREAVYEAAATLGGWDRAALERKPVPVAVPDADLSKGAREHPPEQPSP